MDLSNLPKTTSSKKKRLGRGYGSGVGGHASTRGEKGQKARSKVSLWFEGGQLPQIRRFPFIRGKGRFVSLKKPVVEINLDALNQFKDNDVIDHKKLVTAKLVSQNELKHKHVRILGRGKLTKSLTVKLDTSQQAREKIEAAGGSVTSETHK